MSDNETTTPEVTPATSAPEAPKPASSEGELPTWAREQITAANSEAANFRVQLKEEKKSRKALEDQIAALTTEKSAAVASASEAQSHFDKVVAAVRAEVPNEHVFAFAKTLQGSTDEELSAHAAELKSMFGVNPGPSPAVDRSQGQGSGTKNDPAAEFTKLLHSKLSR